MNNAIATIEGNLPNLTNQKRATGYDLVTEDKAGLKEQLEALSGEQIAALWGRVAEDRAGRWRPRLRHRLDDPWSGRTRTWDVSVWRDRPCGEAVWSRGLWRGSGGR